MSEDINKEIMALEQILAAKREELQKTTMDNKEQANKKLSNLLEQVKNLITEAEILADKHGLVFQSPISAYGIGGTYTGKGWESSEDESGWNSSSCTYY